VSAPDEPHISDRWSRRDALRTVWSGCAVAALAAFAEGCSGGVGGSTGAAALRSPAADRPIELTSSAPPTRDGVALTFHGDGPPGLATALLGEAERAGARVTVLAVGRWLGEHPQLARRVLDGGHELGNHTEHHLAIDALGPAAAYAEIEACAARLRKLTGSAGRWFRPSQGQHASATVRAAAARAGYPTVLSYDVDALDYTDPGPDAVVRTVLSAVRPGDVVSMHLGHQGTVAALPVILDGLRSRGLRPVTASELFPQVLSVPEVAHR
jgi:peptidoglycan/xylan/chitin deacetylase (PgdA/CDA1 family)